MPASGLTARRFWTTIGVATIAVAVACVFAVCVGSTGSFGWPSGTLNTGTLGRRFEIVALATFVGLALGCAGSAYQAVLRNDLADPYLLGIASGAALCAYLWRLPALASEMAHLGATASILSQQTFTFAGAIGAAAIVLLLAGTRSRVEPAKLVLTGVIVSTICGAVMLLLFTLVNSLPGSGYVQSVFVGQLQTSLSRAQLWTAGAIIVAGCVALLARSPRLNILTLGDDEARSLGLHASRERLLVLTIASLVTAAGVSVSGPVGFVGLIAPHVARRVVGADLRLSLPLAGVGGAMLIVLADALLRFLAGSGAVNTIIPIGVATALLGGPFFLALLLRRREES